MTRYFFHVRDGETIIDEEGTEYPTLEDARTAAIKTAGEMLKESPGNFWKGDEWEMRVTDASGLTMFTLNFSGSIAPAGR